MIIAHRINRRVTALIMINTLWISRCIATARERIPKLCDRGE
ncbi:MULTISPECIES: hypothetical protein [Photorhabdus]|uniref:Uncharacterized protein n=1 Tax=Photorhabdus bodei TaxID=2029681 RepID=A0AAW6BPU7_9GAMM|nr:hypothetical protein [Photorhabdus bodei]MDB6369377.1 hypothetical protein [Photorhabdus bodei]MDB6374861.1 hypothetical protein [Photorhabdus bodei]